MQWNVGNSYDNNQSYTNETNNKWEFDTHVNKLTEQKQQ